MIYTCEKCKKVSSRDMKVCEVCQTTHYCSDACQDAHRTEHNKLCREGTRSLPIDNRYFASPQKVTPEQQQYRNMISDMISKIEGPCCHVCGDTDKLIRIGNGVLCSDCLRIQEGMRAF